MPPAPLTYARVFVCACILRICGRVLATLSVGVFTYACAYRLCPICVFFFFERYASWAWSLARAGAAFPPKPRRAPIF